MVSVAERVPSLIVNVQCPFATGVTPNEPLPLTGEIAAIPLHEFAVPAGAVVAVNAPEKPASDAVKVCAAAAPVVRNDKLGGVKVGGAGGGDGEADGVAAGVGTVTAEAVPPAPLHAHMVPSATATAAARNPWVRRSPTVASSVVSMS